MEFVEVGIKVLISIVLIAFFVILLFKLVAPRRTYLERTILANSGNNTDVNNFSFYKQNEFFKMINAGEDLCHDDISFEFEDYCGPAIRMYLMEDIQNETSD